VVIEALCYKPEGRGFDSREFFFSIYQIHPATLGPGIYIEQKLVPEADKMFLGSKARLVRETDNLTAAYEPIV
jgi:hypothetical protein